MRLTGTTIFGNDFGLVTIGTGVIDSCGDNQVFGNGPSNAPTNGIANAGQLQPGCPGTCGRSRAAPRWIGLSAAPGAGIPASGSTSTVDPLLSAA